MDLVKMLNEILEDYSDVRVAHLTGIERTRLNRIRNGKFKITLPELQKIISAFVTDDNQANKLYDAYLFDKIGRDKYNSRILAKEFLESLREADPQDPDFDGSYARTNISSDFDIEDDLTVLRSPVAVRHAMNMVMMQAMSQKEKIRIISSSVSEYLLSQIFTVTSAAPDLEIDHIYSLAAENELPEPLTYYMGVAKAVYPIFMLNSNYRAYYMLVGHATNALMPYHIITNRFGLLLDPTFSNAILVKKKDVVMLAQHLFDDRKKKCSAFITKINSTEEYLLHYCNILERTDGLMKDLYYSIDYEPCRLDFLTEKEIYGCMERVKGNPKAANLVKEFVGKFYTPFMQNKQISFFTKEGLHSFIDTGTIKEIPETLGLVVDKKRRIEMLQCVLSCMKDEKSGKIYYLINEKEFKPPLGLRYFGAGVKADHMFVISNSYSRDSSGENKEAGKVPSILILTNSEILSAVFDFIESLPETKMVYSREESIEYMENVISEMKKELSEQ